MFKKSPIWALGILLVGCYVSLANNGHHHWHEFRFLYSAAFYSTSELMQGVFDPGPAPVRPAQQVAEWYASELLHVLLLRKLVTWFGMSSDCFTIIKLVYAAMLIVAVGLAGGALKQFGLSTTRAMLIAAVALLNPVTVYLGFKLMGEAPSLLFAVTALNLFLLGHRRPQSRFALCSLAGLTLALSALCSARIPLLFLGFWVSFILIWSPAGDRSLAVRSGLVTWSSFFICWPIGFGLLGGSFSIYLKALASFLTFGKELPMWLFAAFNLILAGAGLWLLLPLAWLSSEKRLRSFFVAWLAFSVLPVMLATVNFMEPRYLIVGLVPFAGLIALGCEVLWVYAENLSWKLSAKVAAGVAVWVFLIATTGVAQGLMPYETDAGRLVEAVDSEASGTTVILVPWNYSDFHLLRFLFPDKPIYLVQSAATEAGKMVHDPVWTARRKEMYGEHYFPEAAALTSVADRKMLLIGWTILPSLQNLFDSLKFIGVHRFAEKLESGNFRNHLTESWLWQDRQFSLRERAQYGQYRVYEVRRTLLDQQ